MARRRGAGKRTAQEMRAEQEGSTHNGVVPTEPIGEDSNDGNAEEEASKQDVDEHQVDSNTTPTNDASLDRDNSARDELEEKDVEMTSAVEEDGEQNDRRHHWQSSSDEDEEEENEEILVVLELADFKNHPILDDYKSITIEGIDTPNPTLHIGEYSLYGKLEETVGTHYFYDTTNRTNDDEYRYTGQTTKKIKFTIASPDEL